MAKTPYHKAAERRENAFDRILRDGLSSGNLPGKAQQAREWYRNKARSSNPGSTQDLVGSDPSRFRQTVEIGRMYMFLYDPKTKADLPYYDTFPLIFPFEEYGNGFMGLNMHYLPPSYRAKLMDALYNITNNRLFDRTTKLRLTYTMLKNASELSFFRPCVKKYLKSYVRSRFIAIGAEEWDIALFLPTEKFEKATKQTVWSDSKRIIANAKPFGTKRARKPVNPHRR